MIEFNTWHIHYPRQMFKRNDSPNSNDIKQKENFTMFKASDMNFPLNMWFNLPSRWIASQNFFLYFFGM